PAAGCAAPRRDGRGDRRGRHRGPRLAALIGYPLEVPVFVSGASGGTSRYWSTNWAIRANAGAATTPPQIAPCGSSPATRIAERGVGGGKASADRADTLGRD